MSLTTLAQHQVMWEKVLTRRCWLEQQRLKPPQTRLWDGDWVLRGEVAGERAGDFEHIENDTGTAMIQLPIVHYLAKWVMNFKGRDKRNVHVTFDKQGTRWSGFMDNFKVVRDKLGDVYLEITFKNDYEHAKHILVWSNPFLRPELQWPKAWVIFGPAKWCLLMTLFVNLLRLETSLWSLPDDPLDPTEWMGLSFYTGFWRQIVKPFPFLADNSTTSIVFSRFKTFHDTAKKVLEDSQLTLTPRRYLEGEDEHPFHDLKGIMGFDNIEELFKKVPIRHGCLVWDIEDNSGWGTETAFGGSLLTGFVRAVTNIAADGTTEGIDVFTGDPTFPGEYWNPGFTGTRPQAPHVVFIDGPYTGIETSEFTYYEATDTSFVGGGQSTPGINEGISAGINIGGDILTSFINSQLAAGTTVPGVAIDLPPLGGMIDAVAKPQYENVFAAFQQTPTLRAAGLPLPIAGLEQLSTGLGDFHLYEAWVEFEKAFTLSAFAATRQRIFETRARTSHVIKVSDAAPHLIGATGYGHIWLGQRAGTTVAQFPIPWTIFVERVKKIKYEWGKDGPKGWKMELGRQEQKDPGFKALEWVRDLNGAFGELGIL